ncbi:MAG: hypothetical protein EA384_02850 [Spirochaetaceae bacterium]|nr:MAG: hypothetical protein EA384_02850 [Spirochaetaceae bacterium]
MSLLGIDVGTTGCKSAVFSADGSLLALRYVEYDIQRPQPRTAELDSQSVWAKIHTVIREAVAASAVGRDIRAVAVASMGENMVPVSRDRSILGPSILNVDCRGEEYLADLESRLPNARLYGLNGNVWGNQYSLPKLMWIRQYQPELYEKTYKFLHWSSFVTFMLGGEPMIDYSLANRSLLLDIHREDWSDELLQLGGIDREKLPATVASGVQVGSVGARQAEELGIPAGTPLVSGAHDQCANQLGCGVIEDGMAMYGMGTFPTIAPVFCASPSADVMIGTGLNTEHHAVPGRFVSFIFHMGGSAVKWYRDTFAAEEHRRAQDAGDDVYPRLFGEMPAAQAPLLLLPRFAPMGPPDFEADACAAMLGLSLETRRGDVLKAIVEGNTLALNLSVERLPQAGINVDSFRAVGGGSRSDGAVQIAADIFGRPMTRSLVGETGALGAALLAGVGCRVYRDFREAVTATVQIGDTFEPNPGHHARYQEVFALYKEFRSLVQPLSDKWNALQRRLNEA